MRLWRAASIAGVLALLATSQPSTAYELDLDDSESIRETAAQMTDDMMLFYKGHLPGQTPGLLPDPYYCMSHLTPRPCHSNTNTMSCTQTDLNVFIQGGEAGALMGALIDYWYYTGDPRYNDLTTQGLLHQVGPNADYMPPNQTRTEGNDDQGFWGMAVMTAAEYNFPNPPPDQPQWLALAQAVFNTQAWRWDVTHCGGGLRWQVFQFNNGFNYKNSISQACFFNMAARLALYTGNSSYARWADRTWDWMEKVHLIDENYYIYDGAHIEDGCTEITPWQFSYNAGAFLLGAAAMYNYTSAMPGEEDFAGRWRERIDGLIRGSKEIFFRGPNEDIMAETSCEPINKCNIDQQSFKAYLSRWMAATTKWAPWTYDAVMPLLRASAAAAARQCTGGDNGRMCGLKWTETHALPESMENNPDGPNEELKHGLKEGGAEGVWDGTTGVGQQMAAMEVVLANLIEKQTAPVTNEDGGTSEGKPNGGGYYADPQIYEGSDDPGDPEAPRDDQGWLIPPAGDAVGGAIVTILALCWLAGFMALMLSDEHAENPLQRRVWRRILWLYGLVTGKKGDSPSPRAREKQKASESSGSSFQMHKLHKPPRPSRVGVHEGPQRLSIRTSSAIEVSSSCSRGPLNRGEVLPWADRTLPPRPNENDPTTIPRNPGKQPCTLTRRGPGSPVPHRDGTTRPFITRHSSTIYGRSTSTSGSGSVDNVAESSSMASARAAVMEPSSCHRRSQSSIIPSLSLGSPISELPRLPQRPHINDRSSSLYYHQAISPRTVDMDKTLPPAPPCEYEEDE